MNTGRGARLESEDMVSGVDEGSGIDGKKRHTVRPSKHVALERLIYLTSNVGRSNSYHEDPQVEPGGPGRP
jgi:hypothetical protein